MNSTLDLNGFSNTVGSLAGSGTVTDNATAAAAAAATLTAGANGSSTAFSGNMTNGRISNVLKRVEAGPLEIAYEESGSIEGKTMVLLHGFPYDVRAYDDVAAILADAGYFAVQRACGLYRIAEQ